jgi:hypothetical protein
VILIDTSAWIEVFRAGRPLDREVTVDLDDRIAIRHAERDVDSGRG